VINGRELRILTKILPIVMTAQPSPTKYENSHMALFLLSLRLSLEGEDKGEGVNVNMTYFLSNISIPFHLTSRCFVPMGEKELDTGSGPVWVGGVRCLNSI
jgi:hypothetical protein